MTNSPASDWLTSCLPSQSVYSHGNRISMLTLAHLLFSHAFPSLSARLYIYTCLYRNTKRITTLLPQCTSVSSPCLSSFLSLSDYLFSSYINVFVRLTHNGVCTRVEFYLRDKNLSVYLCATSPSKSSFTIFRPRLHCLEWNQVCLTSSYGH